MPSSSRSTTAIGSGEDEVRLGRALQALDQIAATQLDYGDDLLETVWALRDRAQEALTEDRDRAAAAPTEYTREDVMKAVDGARTNALEEATNNVCARISAWLMARSVSRRSDNEEQADALEEAALDVRDGEWRRTTDAQPTKGTP